MNKIQTTFAAILLLLAVMPLVNAQDEEGSLSTGVSVISTQAGKHQYFLNVGTDEVPKMEPIRVSTSSVTAPKEYKGSQILSLYRADGQASSGYSRVARCKLLKVKQNIIFLQYGKNGQAGCKSLPIEFSKWTKGARCLVNLTPHSIRGIYSTPSSRFEKIEQKKKLFTCSSRSVITVSPLDIDAGHYYPHHAHLQLKTGTGEWQTLVQNNWFNTPAQRHIVVFYTDPKSGVVLTKGFASKVALSDAEKRSLNSKVLDQE